MIEGQPVSFHFRAVDGETFIGEFQLRTQFPERVLREIGSIGYAVRPPLWGRGYGTAILREGLQIARARGMEKVLLTVNEKNTASIRICESLGGQWTDTVEAYNEAEGRHLLRRYWIDL